MHYSYSDLVNTYRDVGVEEGSIVYIVGNFGAIGLFEENSTEATLTAHLAALFSLIGTKGTIVVPTHCWSLCNTQTPFSLEESPSETGPFSEFIRKQSGSFRQFHPFSSSTAFGYHAEYLCTGNTRHVYGPNSPFSRMIEEDALHVSVGMPLTHAVSLVHHTELIMGVPYRYTKEFVHPCTVDGKLKDMEFYLHVTRRDVDIVRGENKLFLTKLFQASAVNEVQLGRSSVSSARFRSFYDVVVDTLSKDIYAALHHHPKQRASFRA